MAASTSLATARTKLFPGIKRATELVISRAKGSEVFTADGVRYLDFTTGIGVTSTGHCHPKVVAAVQEQAAQGVHFQMSVGYNSRALELIERMQPHVPPGHDSFFFTNSGAEAVEGAVKLARQFKERDCIIAFQGGYHGRTAGTLALTSSSVGYRGHRAGPLPSGTYLAPYPYEYQGISEEFSMRQLELLLKQQVNASEVAAVLIEPVLGEGGYTPAPRSFMEKLREYCDRNDFLLIADEVQSGYGRTGRMFAVEHTNTVPDILVCAKGIASGYPLSAVVTRSEISAAQPKGCMGGTYGGNVVSCAAAIATLDVFEQEEVLENVQARGNQAFASLGELQQDEAAVGDIRGLGLMIGVEFDGKYKGIASAIVKKCLDRGMLVLSTGVHETCRLIPPLTMSEPEMAEGMAIFGESVREAAAELRQSNF